MANNKIKKETDFWKEAMDFKETIVVPEVQQKFADYCKKRKFNHNEVKLFRHMLNGAIDLDFTMAILKNEL